MAMQRILVVLYVCVMINVNANVKVRDCEPIQIEVCKSQGYSNTSMPNFVGHKSQSDAEFQLATFRPLIEYGCSEHLQFFLCSVYAPMCTEKVRETLGPCRPMCLHVQTKCEPILNEFGFPWPAALNCSKFPVRNDDSTMCMMPDGVEEMISTPVAPLPRYSGVATVSTPLSQKCAHLRNGPDKYIYQNQSNPPGCVLKCHEHDLFSEQDKKFTQIFLAIFSISCLVLTAFTVLTFLIDAERFRYPERPVIIMAFCYMCCSIAYVVRLGVGRETTICETDHYAKVDVLITDGLQNTFCTIIFLLLYYFGTAAHIWWIILAITWFLAAGRKWSHESVHRHSSLFHLAAWGIPAAATILVLLLRHVDADELTGMCFVGNRNRENLMLFVIAPLCMYLFLGVGLFMAGFVGLLRIRKHLHSKGGKTERLELLMIKICIFSLVYALSNVCVVGCYIYEYMNMSHWLATSESKTPNMEIFMLKIVCSLVGGFATGIWIWNGKTIKSWKGFFPRLCGCQRSIEKAPSSVNTSHAKLQYKQPNLRQSPVGMNYPANLNSSYSPPHANIPLLFPGHHTSIDSCLKGRSFLDGGETII